MPVDIVEVEVVGDLRLRVEFEDGTSGEIDVQELVKLEGVFESLRDPEYFELVRVDRDLGTVVWPNGAALDPVVVREHLG